MQNFLAKIITLSPELISGASGPSATNVAWTCINDDQWSLKEVSFHVSSFDNLNVTLLSMDSSSSDSIDFLVIPPTTNLKAKTYHYRRRSCKALSLNDRIDGSSSFDNPGFLCPVSGMSLNPSAASSSVPAFSSPLPIERLGGGSLFSSLINVSESKSSSPALSSIFTFPTLKLKFECPFSASPSPWRYSQIKGGRVGLFHGGVERTIQYWWTSPRSSLSLDESPDSRRQLESGAQFVPIFIPLSYLSNTRHIYFHLPCSFTYSLSSAAEVGLDDEHDKGVESWTGWTHGKFTKT